MSYTLRGRVETRLAAALVALVVACALGGALREWWPLELALLMVGVGLALDVAAYHRLLPYQPGWVAVPLGGLELGVVLLLAWVLGLAAPLTGGIALFLVAWLAAQALGHAGLPLLRLSYGDDGGELGPAGAAAAVLIAALLAGGGGVAWATRPPTYHLAGVIRGPLVLDHPQTLVGGPETVVRGGIVITSDDVTVRDVAVVGGANGIEVTDVERVVLDGVSVSGAQLDGINVRRSQVAIRDCAVRSRRDPYAQGIEISFGLGLPPSVVERCTVSGGGEGIVTHLARVMARENTVSDTSLRGITLTEMSMASAERNRVTRATGVGIYCGDHSMCELERNAVGAVRPDRASGDPTRMGYGIVAQLGGDAELRNNTVPSRRGTAAFLGGTLEHHR
jgi:hypothetical protein